MKLCILESCPKCYWDTRLDTYICRENYEEIAEDTECFEDEE